MTSPLSGRLAYRQWMGAVQRNHAGKSNDQIREKGTQRVKVDPTIRPDFEVAGISNLGIEQKESKAPKED